MTEKSLEERVRAIGGGDETAGGPAKRTAPRRSAWANRSEATVAAEAADLTEVVLQAGEGEACAHLGLEQDPFGHYARPSGEHRCYLWMQRDRIDQLHQKRFCLTSSSKTCPWLSISAPKQAKPIARAKEEIRRGLAGGLAETIENLDAGWQRTVLTAGLVIGSTSARFVRIAWRFGRPAAIQLGIVLLAGLRLAVPILVWPVVWLSRNYLGIERGLLRGTKAAGSWVWSLIRPPKARPAAGETAAATASSTPIAKPVLARPEGVSVDEVAVEAAALYQRRGLEAMQEGDLASALRRFRLATAANEQDEQGWLWRGALAETAEEKAECFRRALDINPQSTRARSVMMQLGALADDRAGEGRASETQQGSAAADVRKPVELAPTWSCADCAAVNPKSAEACQRCGRPSPKVEAELTAGGGFLRRGLEAMRAGNETVAYHCFSMMTQTDPTNEQAWYWRAKTAATLTEVIDCLEHIIRLNPANAKAQADLRWAQERQARVASEAVLTAPAEDRHRAAANRLVSPLRSALVQLASVCVFAGGLLLSLPYVANLMQIQSTPETQPYLNWLPGYRLPAIKLGVLPGVDLGEFAPLALALLLLHTAFSLADRPGLGTRIWAAMLAAGTIVLALGYVTSAQAGNVGALIGAAAAITALAGKAQREEETTSVAL